MRLQWHNRQLKPWYQLLTQGSEGLTTHFTCKVDISIWLTEYTEIILNWLQTSTLPTILGHLLYKQRPDSDGLFNIHFLITPFTEYFLTYKILKYWSFPEKKALRTFKLVTKFSIPFAVLSQNQLELNTAPLRAERMKQESKLAWDWTCFAMWQPPRSFPSPFM